MDRSWISKHKSSESYKKGVEEFLRFASQNPPEAGKVICPCNRCMNNELLKRSTARKHLLNHGFDRYYTRWIFHGEFDPTACSTEGSIELPEKNDEDVNRGDDSKSPEEQGGSTSHPKPAKDKGKASLEQDEESDQLEILFSDTEEEQEGPDDQKIKTHLSMMCSFAYDLYRMRKKYGCDNELLDYLIRSLTKRFPLFYSLPQCFNHVRAQLNPMACMPTEYGSGSSNREPILEQQDRNGRKCYACGQEIKPGASASTSSKRGKRNKKKPWKKNAK